MKKQIILTKNGKQYVSEAITNSKQFLKDAKILIENGSFAHGAALAVLAIEEGAKAKIATQYIDWKGVLEVDFLLFYAQNERNLSESDIAKMVRGVGFEPTNR